MSYRIIRHSATIAVAVALIFAADIFTGPYILFPITYVLPVGAAGWWYGRAWGVVLALAMSLARFHVVHVYEPELVRGVMWIAAVNALIRALVLVTLACLIARVAHQLRLLSQRVEVLEGILPICAFCKRIRNEAGQWEGVEVYIAGRSKAQFSHGFCEACAREHYPEVFGAGAAPPGADRPHE